MAAGQQRQRPVNIVQLLSMFRAFKQVLRASFPDFCVINDAGDDDDDERRAPRKNTRESTECAREEVGSKRDRDLRRDAKPLFDDDAAAVLRCDNDRLLVAARRCRITIKSLRQTARSIFATFFFATQIK